MAKEIADNAELSRYELHVDGVLAGLIDYHLRDGLLSLVGTEVVAGFEGQGIGSELVRAALADVRERGLEVAPLCPFVAAYIRKHPDEYLDLVAASYRGRLTSHE